MVDENNTEKIYSTGFASLIANLISAAFFGIGTYKIFAECNNDAYIAAIIGIIASILPLTMLIFINKNSKGLDIIDLNINLLGKFFGNILNIVLNVTYFFITVVIFYNITEFLSIYYLPDTSIIYIQLMLLVVITFASGKNMVVISKISQLVFIINMIFFLTCQLGIFEEFNLERIYPVMQNGINPVVKGSLMYFLLAAFPIFLVTIIPSYKLEYDKNSTKKISIFYFLAHLVLLVIIFTTILTLGKELILIYRYPEYYGLKTFSLFKILERLENTLSLQFIFTMFIFIVMCFKFITISVGKIVKLKNINKIFPYVLSILLVILVNKFFENLNQSKSIALDSFDKIAGAGILIPMLITTVKILIDKQVEKSKKTK